jgi:two-component system, cell cycle sensor histidine kinase and response regulator CckA
MSDTPPPAPAFEAIFQALPEAVAVFDSRGTIVYANPRFAALHGFPLEEIVGSGFARLTPDPEGQVGRMLQFFEAPVQRDEASAQRVHGLHRDGRVLDLEVTTSPLTTPEGTFGVLVARDRTDQTVRDRAEIQARHREAVLDLGRLALSEIAFDELLQRATAITVETLGVDRALISEQHEGQLVRRAVAGELGVLASTIPVSRAPMSARALVTGATILRGGPDQPPVPEILSEDGICLAAVIPIRGPAERFGILGAYRRERGVWTADEVGFLESLAHLLSSAVEGDAARRAAAATQARLQAILDNSPVAIAIKDLEGRYVVINRRCEELLGIDPVTAIGRTSEDVFPAEIADALQAHDREVLRAGHPIQVEDTMEHADGSHVYRTLKFPMRGEDGKVYGIGLIATDVTDGLRSEEERKDLEARLHRVDRLESIGRLAGGIAHDFNNLLAVIRNYAQFLIEDLPEGTQSREDLEQIRRAVDRATSLTRQLLIFARKERSAPRPLQLNEIVGDTERLLHRTLGEDIHLRTRLDPGLPHVELDPGQAEQVLINLALNARDAMPAGGTLTIATARGEDDSVLLSVSDTGTGMAPEIADRAFEPFYTSKPEGKGTGLGLAMVYGVITGAGGDVDLVTAEGEGTTLTLSLPATEAPVAEDAPVVGEVPRGKGETVLLVEDADALRDLTRRILVEAGYAVLEARNGVQAVRIVARQGPVDLLLSDIVMPGMSGNDLAMRLREKDPGIPIVFMSGYTDDALLGGDFTTTALLAKPFDAEQLLRAVRAELDRAVSARAQPGSGG